MRRLQCSGKQLLLDVSYTDKADGKRASDTYNASCLQRNLPAHDLAHSVQQSGSKTDEVAFVKEPSSAVFPNLAQGRALGDECQTGRESNEPLLLPSLGNVQSHKQGEQAVEADPDHGLSLEDLRKTQPSDSEKTDFSAGEKIHSPLPMPVHQPTEQHADDEDEDEGHRAPLELMAEFLTAVMCQNFKVARSLCQMILIYEPENAEAKLFLPLIQLKLQDDGNDEDGSDSSEDDDDGTGDSGSDESPQNTGSSSSSTSSSSSGDEEEKD